MPFDAEGRNCPYFDDEIQSLVIGHASTPDGTDMLVSITPMIFNDRIVVTPRNEYPGCLAAGFCYDKGPAARMAAAVWLQNWEDMDVPPGFKKEACNDLPRYGKGTRK